ncbi:RNA polymerase sigma factor [Streptomyces phaeochromogenes]|uniref:RNA polymerase sigma factor n=1 Tax=Streptomyces phaeochromogenes TaxID=1923 RepID=UPI0033F59A13
MARNVLANEQRGLRRGGRLSARLRRTTPVAPAAPDHAEGVVTGLHLREALGTLSERDREALQLVGWEGLDTQQAARVVGCSARAFAVRLHRARRRLESALERTEQEEPRGRLHELDGELGGVGYWSATEGEADMRAREETARTEARCVNCSAPPTRWPTGW